VKRLAAEARFEEGWREGKVAAAAVEERLVWGGVALRKKGGESFGITGAALREGKASNGNGDLLRSALLRLFTAAVSCACHGSRPPVSR
jgi:hypothetical protein